MFSYDWEMGNSSIRMSKVDLLAHPVLIIEME